MMNSLLKRIITSLFLILILCFCLFYSDLSWKILVSIFSVICFYEFCLLINKVYINKILSTILIFLIGLYLYFFYLLIIKINSAYGSEIILILIITCVFSDIGGYIFGKLIGGPKLSKISPNKTISGSIGSIFFTIIGTCLFVLFLNKIDKDPILLEFSIVFLIWLIMMSVFCQVGDLFISYLKRKANVKDTGKILPGHGGILDRVDGMIFAIPFGALLYLTLGLDI